MCSYHNHLSSLFPLTLHWISLVKVYLLFTNNFFLASERMAALYQMGNILLRGRTAFIPISSFKTQIWKCRIAFPGGCLTVQQGCKQRATFLNCPEHPEHASCSSISYSDIQITALQKTCCFNTSSSPVGWETHPIFQQTAGPVLQRETKRPTKDTPSYQAMLILPAIKLAIITALLLYRTLICLFYCIFPACTRSQLL